MFLSVTSGSLTIVFFVSTISAAIGLATIFITLFFTLGNGYVKLLLKVLLAIFAYLTNQSL